MLDLAFTDKTYEIKLADETIVNVFNDKLPYITYENF